MNNTSIYSRQTLFWLCTLILFGVGEMWGQGAPNPASWRFRNGNPEGTRYQEVRSARQTFDQVQVKWTTPQIFGNMNPLIGNLLDTTFGGNPRVSLQAIALNSASIVIIGGDGKTVTSASLMNMLPDPVQPLGVSVLIDGLAFGADAFSPLIWGLEMMEQVQPDSSAFTYLMGYNKVMSQMEVLSRLKVDLRQYGVNNYASITPVFGRAGAAGGPVVYAYVDIGDPQGAGQPNLADNTYNSTPFGFPSLRSSPVPYFRGLATFNTENFTFPFPQPDTFDDTLSRIMSPHSFGYAPNFATPSISDGGANLRMALPVYYGRTPLRNGSGVRSLVRPELTLNRDSVYLHQFNLSNPLSVSSGFANLTGTFNLTSSPQFRPFYVGNINPSSPSNRYILLAEEYGGMQGSSFRAPELHILRENGVVETLPGALVDTISNENIRASSEVLRSFVSPQNGHRWSIAIGNIDGDIDEIANFYPNNPGNEIVATMTTPPTGTVSNNRLFVLRYNTAFSRTPKPSLQDSLRYLDTICSMRITGWLAAVNDFDGDENFTLPNGQPNPHYRKDEIFIVNNTRLFVLRMRPYRDLLSQLPPFDTVFTFEAPGSISSVAIVDMDGDGRNDILLTTQDRTILLGVPQVGQIEFENPALTDRFDLCAGDIFPLRWVNRTVGPDFLNIFFQKVDELGNDEGEPRLIAGRVPNVEFQEEFSLTIDTATLTRGEGYFLIEGFQEPSVQARSGVVSITNASVTITMPTTGTIVTVGTFLPLSGITRCIDDINVFYRNPDMGPEWSPAIANTIPDADGTFELDIAIACDRFFFNDCIDPATDTLIEFLVVGRRVSALLFSDSTIVQVRPVPARFDITVDRPEVFCPTRILEWDPEEIGGAPDAPFFSPCTEFIVRISLDSGRTFRDFAVGGLGFGDLLYPASPDNPESALIRIGSYMPENVVQGGRLVWKVPPEAPDSVIFRFCCQGTACIIAEVGVNQPRPSFVKVVAPNPFRGDSDPVEVTYTVNEFINANISIYDQSNRLVARPVVGQLRAPNTTYCDRWDGRKADGTPAANGFYYLIVELDNGLREVYTIYLARDY